MNRGIFFWWYPSHYYDSSIEHDVSDVHGYVDEADLFYDDPMGWLSNAYGNGSVAIDAFPPYNVCMFVVLVDEIEVGGQDWRSCVEKSDMSNGLLLLCKKQLIFL